MKAPKVLQIADGPGCFYIIKSGWDNHYHVIFETPEDGNYAHEHYFLTPDEVVKKFPCAEGMLHEKDKTGLYASKRLYTSKEIKKKFGYSQKTSVVGMSYGVNRQIKKVGRNAWVIPVERGVAHAQ